MQERGGSLSAEKATGIKTAAVEPCTHSQLCNRPPCLPIREDPAAVWRQAVIDAGQGRLCQGRRGNLGICHENAQVCRTPAKFLFEKTGTVHFFKKKIQGYAHRPGQFRETQSRLPRFFVCRIISVRTVRRREGVCFK